MFAPCDFFTLALIIGVINLEIKKKQIVRGYCCLISNSANLLWQMSQNVYVLRTGRWKYISRPKIFVSYPDIPISSTMLIFRSLAHLSDSRGSCDSLVKRSPRHIAKRGRTRSITPWSVTGVSYATFCCLASLLPALVLSCLERGVNYNLLPWWWYLSERWRKPSAIPAD